MPCPFCGLTTITVAITHGERAAANPLVYLPADLSITCAGAGGTGGWADARAPAPGRQTRAAAPGA